MSKIILNLALSLDGYIADENGGFDWIVGEEGGISSEEKHEYQDFLDTIDVIVMGSKAYKDTPEESIISFADKKILLASSKEIQVSENVEIVSGDFSDRVLELKEGGKNIWLFGGGLTIDLFLKKDIIDEFIIGIIPTILGRGRRLFLENNPTIKLHLVKTIVDSGITLLFYTKR